MKNFSTLCLGNRVLVSGEVLDVPGYEEGVISGITKEEVDIIHRPTGKTYKCKLDQIETIGLDNMILTSLGFTERVLTDSRGITTEDKIKSSEPKNPGDIWYLISLKETKRGFFLSVLENGIEVLGTGYPKTLNQLQNMVRHITDEKYEI